MKHQEAYRPDISIKDVYEGTLDNQPYKELGLSPYARIGSLTKINEKKYTIYVKWPKKSVNFHHFTYVGPLVGSSLSPDDRKLKFTSYTVRYKPVINY